MKRSLRSWLWRVPLDQEVDDEIAFHLEMRTRELVDRGMDPNAARLAAIERLGDLADLKRTCLDLGRKRDREMRLVQWLRELRADVIFAVRQLRASPAFALVAAITLALGIGANSAIFALVDATLLRPLPYPDPERLVMVWERSDTSQRSRVAPLNLLDWNERNRTFDLIAGFTPEHRRHGHERRGWHRRNGPSPVGDGRVLRGASGQGNCRTHVSSVRRQAAFQCCRVE